jgi:3',5'-cyclic-AMP phosphodiesterase
LTLSADGQIETQVKRLANGAFQPDFNANGY